MVKPLIVDDDVETARVPGSPEKLRVSATMPCPGNAASPWSRIAIARLRSCGGGPRLAAGRPEKHDRVDELEVTRVGASASATSIVSIRRPWPRPKLTSPVAPLSLEESDGEALRAMLFWKWSVGLPRMCVRTLRRPAVGHAHTTSRTPAVAASRMIVSSMRTGVSSDESLLTDEFW